MKMSLIRETVFVIPSNKKSRDTGSGSKSRSNWLDGETEIQVTVLENSGHGTVSFILIDPAPGSKEHALCLTSPLIAQLHLRS